MMQSALQLLFPAACILCEARVDDSFALCGTCWRDTPFIHGAICDRCGLPLPGEVEAGLQCDDCMALARPWGKGRAALLYKGNGRRIVLSLKHGDRQDLARPTARWLAAAATDLVHIGTVLVPIPLHWRRMFRRRYNQSALLAHGMARLLDLTVCPDALVRKRVTASQDHRSVTERFDNLQDAIAPNPRRPDDLRGKPVLLIDDVMTSGATFAAATEAALAAGAASVSVLALARVAKDA